MILIDVAVYGPAQRQQATLVNKHQKPFLKKSDFSFFVCLFFKCKRKRKKRKKKKNVLFLRFKRRPRRQDLACNFLNSDGNQAML